MDVGGVTHIFRDTIYRNLKKSCVRSAPNLGVLLTPLVNGTYSK